MCTGNCFNSSIISVPMHTGFVGLFMSIFCSRLILWFSDSADWMWPCDPWLPGRAWWDDGYWGYSRGEPTTEDYPRSEWYASFMCGCLFMCMIRLAVGAFWLTLCDCREEKEEKDSQIDWPGCHDLSLSVKSKYDIGAWTLPCFGHQVIWENKQPTWCLCCKGVLEAPVCMQRDRECVLRVHPSRVSLQFLRWIRGKFFMYWLCSEKPMEKFWRFWKHTFWEVCMFIWKYTRDMTASCFHDDRTILSAWTLANVDNSFLYITYCELVFIFISVTFRGCCRACKRVQGMRGANHRWQYQPAQILLQAGVLVTGMNPSYLLQM